MARRNLNRRPLPFGNSGSFALSSADHLRDDSAHAVGAVAKLAAMTLAESFCKSLADEWIFGLSCNLLASEFDHVHSHVSARWHSMKLVTLCKNSSALSSSIRWPTVRNGHELGAGDSASNFFRDRQWCAEVFIDADNQLRLPDIAELRKIVVYRNHVDAL
jgi:diadenosine tetraphosphate (Ap4A) HIT family hydrolase